MINYIMVAHIAAENVRQMYLHSDFAATDAEKLVILAEEIGEIAAAIQNKDDENLKEELVQVAAVCCRWLAEFEEFKP